VTDLPSPEEVVGAPRVTGRILLASIIGPSLIALGVSIGSGEWLLGPFNFAKYGFLGIGWIILVLRRRVHDGGRSRLPRA